MKMFASRRGRAVCALVALAVLGAACGNAGSSKKRANDSGATSDTVYSGGDYTKNVAVDAPGVTSTEIHVASITSKTNPLGTNFTDFNDGIKAYLATVNADGGIYGRTLKLTSERDDQTSSNGTEVQAMLAQDNVYAVFVATELFTGAPKLEAAGIPTFGWNINAEWAGPKNFFSNVRPVCFTDCTPQPHIVVWAAGQVHAKKVAVLAYSVPQAADCAKGDAQSFKNFGSKVGASVVYQDASLSFGQTDYSAQVSKMKSAGVDFVTTCLDNNGDYALAREMQKQGILDKVTFFHPNLYDADFVQKNAKVFEGGIVQVNITAVEHTPATPGVKEYLTYAKAHDLTIDELSMQGWIAAQEFVDSLKAAGPSFTWANLVSAWNKTTWYTGNGWLAPANWTQDHTPGKSEFECSNFVKIHDGKFEPIWDSNGKPWVCFDGTKPDVWQDAVNVSFGNKPFTLADAH